MLKTLLMPNNTTALARLRKALNEIDSSIKINGWVSTDEDETLRLSIYHPFIATIAKNTDLSLAICKEKIDGSREIRLTIDTDSDNMLGIDLNQVATLLTQNV